MRFIDLKRSSMQFPTSRATQLGANPPQIVRRESRYAELGGVLAQHLPDDLLAEPVANDAIASDHRTEDVAFDDARWHSPRIHRHFHPGWHRSRSGASMLADEIDNAPAAISLLNVREGK